MTVKHYSKYCEKMDFLQTHTWTTLSITIHLCKIPISSDVFVFVHIVMSTIDSIEAFLHKGKVIGERLEMTSFHTELRSSSSNLQ